MAPRKRQAGAAAARNQSTLTFNGRTNKITKPSAQAPSSKSEKLDATPVPTPPATDEVDVSELADTTSERVVLEQAQEEVKKAVSEKKTPEEAEAEKITEAQIKKYWRNKEQLRKVKRIHQEDVPLRERVLREFDVSSQYGPSIGITRVKRWKRAHRLRLDPPIEVLAVLLKEQGDGNLRAQRSHVDELMSSRFTEVSG